MRVVIKLNEIDSARSMGDYDTQYDEGVGQGTATAITLLNQANNTPQEKEKVPPVTLAELINKYSQENIKAQAWECSPSLNSCDLKDMR